MTKPANDDATTTPQDRGQKGFRMLLALACLIVVLAGLALMAYIGLSIALRRRET